MYRFLKQLLAVLSNGGGAILVRVKVGITRPTDASEPQYDEHKTRTRNETGTGKTKVAVPLEGEREGELNQPSIIIPSYPRCRCKISPSLEAPKSAQESRSSVQKHWPEGNND